MKQRLAVLLFMAFILLGVLVALGHTQTRSAIVLRGARVIHVGDAWSLHVRVSNASAGDTVSLTVLNGLRRLDTLLKLDVSGEADWDIPEAQLIEAGDSIVTARYETLEARRTLRILPGDLAEVDLMTTANNLSAYGEDHAMLIVLPRDRWGNPPSDQPPLAAVAQFPDGSRQDLDFHRSRGIAWIWLRSRGAPGRIRIRLQDDLAYLELMQTPGAVAHIRLEVSPDCVLNDGRDVVNLVAIVTDSNHYPVINGTQVTFNWRDGFGYGQTIEGRATLRMPSPSMTGMLRLDAHSDSAYSNTASLRVVERNCPNG